jgi:monofunctional biosynthetic peptidoglycan transglycosylase
MPEKEGRFSLRTFFRCSVLILIGFLAFSMIQVTLIRFLNPGATPLMVYSRLTGEGSDFRWLPLSEISPFLQQAVIAAEDQRFLDHQGFDWKEIEQALHEYRHEGRRRGASTITMQVARNLYLWQGRSWLRKSLEAYYTVLIELLWPKWRIMEVYLNVAEWGQGIFGAEAAARRYFRRSAEALTRGQAALLAAVLPNPHRWSPEHPTRYIRERQATIMHQMNWFRPIMESSEGGCRTALHRAQMSWREVSQDRL